MDFTFNPRILNRKNVKTSTYSTLSEAKVFLPRIQNDTRFFLYHTGSFADLYFSILFLGDFDPFITRYFNLMTNFIIPERKQNVAKRVSFDGHQRQQSYDVSARIYDKDWYLSSVFFDVCSRYEKSGEIKRELDTMHCVLLSKLKIWKTFIQKFSIFGIFFKVTCFFWNFSIL